MGEKTRRKSVILFVLSLLMTVVFTFAQTIVGELRWKFKTDGEAHPSLATDTDGAIHVGSDDYWSSYLHTPSPDRTLKWSFETEGWISSSPAIVADETIYVGSWDKYLYAINPDGKLKWRFQTGGRIDSSPAIGEDGKVYVGSNDGCLYAISTDSKRLANSPWPKFMGNLRNTGRYGDN